MSSNSELLRKADMTLTELSSAGGVLNTEQARQFIRKVINQPTILRDARVVGMGAPTRMLNKIGFGSRILRAGVQSVALTQAQRAKPNFEKVELNAKLVMAQVNIPYDVMEDNIERATSANNEASNTGPGGLRQTIIELIGERAALDLEEMMLLSDTASGDADLAIQDGVLKLANATGNVVNFANQPVTKKLFKQGKKALPDQYLRNVPAMRHYISHDQETEYRDTMADRATALGDQAVTGLAPIPVFGSPIVPVALMPDNKGLFTNPLNLIMGVWRTIRLEFDKDITKQEYIIVLTTRVAFQIEETEALVHYTNIAA